MSIPDNDIGTWVLLILRFTIFYGFFPDAADLWIPALSVEEISRKMPRSWADRVTERTAVLFFCLKHFALCLSLTHFIYFCIAYACASVVFLHCVDTQIAHSRPCSSQCADTWSYQTSSCLESNIFIFCLSWLSGWVPTIMNSLPLQQDSLQTTTLSSEVATVFTSR